MSKAFKTNEQPPLNAFLIEEFSHPGSVVSPEVMKTLAKHDTLLERIKTVFAERQGNVKVVGMVPSESVTKLKALEELAKKSVAANKKILKKPVNVQKTDQVIICFAVFCSCLAHLLYSESELPLLLGSALNVLAGVIAYVTAELVWVSSINTVACFRSCPSVKLLTRKEESPIPTLEFVKRKQQLLKCLRDEVIPMRRRISDTDYKKVTALVWFFSALFYYSTARVFTPYHHLYFVATMMDFVYYVIIGLGSVVLAARGSFWIYRYQKSIQC